MKRFTDRVARDLGQIADRAAPSPTAWEEIRQRIDEQTDEPTMEVIMLDPDKRPSRNRPKPWLLVTAAAAAVLIIVGIVVAASGGDDDPDDPNRVTAVDPEPTSPDTDPTAEGEPGEGEAGEDAVAGDPATVSDEELATEGSIDAGCMFGPYRPNPDTGRLEASQDCKFGPADNPPFAETGDWTLAIDESEETQLATALIGGGPDGFVYAGYTGSGFFVGIIPGAGAYEGETVYVHGISHGDRVRWPVPFQWHIGDGPFPAPEAGPDEEVAEVSFECVLTFLDDDGSVATYDQSCTYDGDDPRFVPEPETFTLLVDRGDPLLEAAAGLQFASAVSDTQTLRNGILEDESVIRWRGVRAGTGEFEGRNVDEIAWGNTDDAGTTTGTIWMTARTPGQ